MTCAFMCRPSCELRRSHLSSSHGAFPSVTTKRLHDVFICRPLKSIEILSFLLSPPLARRLCTTGKPRCIRVGHRLVPHDVVPSVQCLHVFGAIACTHYAGGIAGAAMPFGHRAPHHNTKVCVVWQCCMGGGGGAVQHACTCRRVHSLIARVRARVCFLRIHTHRSHYSSSLTMEALLPNSLARRSCVLWLRVVVC